MSGREGQQVPLLVCTQRASSQASRTGSSTGSGKEEKPFSQPTSHQQTTSSKCPSSPGSPTLDDESLAACAWAEVQVQAALKALLDEVGIGGDLHRSTQAGDCEVARPLTAQAGELQGRP